MLVVHHRYYTKGSEPWDYPDHVLVTLCQACHEQEHDLYPEYAGKLVETMKSKGFLAEDFFWLLDAVSGLDMRFPPEVTGVMLKFAMSDSETVELIWKRYWDSLKQRKTDGNKSGNG